VPGEARGSKEVRIVGGRGERSDEVIAFALMTSGNDCRDNPSRPGQYMCSSSSSLLQQLAFVWFHE